VKRTDERADMREHVVTPDIIRQTEIESAPLIRDEPVASPDLSLLALVRSAVALGSGLQTIGAHEPIEHLTSISLRGQRRGLYSSRTKWVR
jgi:hypothetical protein